jgi:hypothetical protein
MTITRSAVRIMLGILAVLFIAAFAVPGDWSRALVDLVRLHWLGLIIGGAAGFGIGRYGVKR